MIACTLWDYKKHCSTLVDLNFVCKVQNIIHSILESIMVITFCHVCYESK